MMLGVLAFLPLIWLVVLLERKLGNWRAAFVAGFLAWTALALCMAEGLGAFSLLFQRPVLGLWILVNVLLLLALGRQLKSSQRPLTVPAPKGFGALVFVLVSVLLCLVLARALLSPPNTSDALSYHLPRQLMWMQQGNLSFFPTRNDRMLMMPPLVELLQLHPMVLSDCDRWANIPQWLSFVAGLVAVSLVTRELGGRRNAQWLSALLVASLPMAYHQASSAKNDLLLGVLVTCAFWLALRCRRYPRKVLGWIGLGLAAGLSLATKSTAALWLLPAALLVFPVALRNRSVAVWALLLALLIPAPHVARNMAWYGTPLGTHLASDGGAQASELISWRTGMSNAARNLGLNLVSPWPAVNRVLDASIENVHEWIGLDTQDRRTTLWNLPYSLAWAPSAELGAGAPFHVLLGIPCLVILIVRWKRLKAAARIAIAVLIVDLLLLCVFLKWQQWGARLQIPHFMLLASLVALVIGGGTARRVMIWSGLVMVAWIPFSETLERPLFSTHSLWTSSRWEDYFRSVPPEQKVQEVCLGVLESAGVGSVLVENIHGFPYPLMRRLRDEKGVRFQMGRAPVGKMNDAPQAILSFPAGLDAPLYREIEGVSEKYRAVGATQLWIAYLPESRARQFARLGVPEFIGWTAVGSLGGWEYLSRNGKPEFLREIPAGGCIMRFDAVGKRLRLQLGFLNLGPACKLVISQSGQEVGEMPIAASPGWQYAEFSIEVAPGSERAIALTPMLSEHGQSRPRLYAARLRLLEETDPVP